MDTVSSPDGTTIAYDTQGEEPAVILVDGVVTVHSSGSGSELAKLLAPHFTVYGFDRRGRGESGRHAALRGRPGDRRHRGAHRPLPAARRSSTVTRPAGPWPCGRPSGSAARSARSPCTSLRTTTTLARQKSWSQYLTQLREALAEGRRGDAVALFMRFVGTPAEQVDGMRLEPFWPGLETVAPTLAYDHAAILGEPWSVPRGLAARLGARPRDGGRRGPSLHARRGTGAEPGDPARPATDAGGSDACGGPGRARSGPGGLLHRLR